MPHPFYILLTKMDAATEVTFHFSVLDNHRWKEDVKPSDSQNYKPPLILSHMYYRGKRKTEEERKRMEAMLQRMLIQKRDFFL